MSIIEDNHNELVSEIENSFTQNLIFRRTLKSDVFPFFNATKHENFNKFILWGPLQDEKEMLLQIEKLLRQDRNKEIVMLSVCEKNTGTWRGAVRLMNLKDGVELSVWLEQPTKINTGEVFLALQHYILESNKNINKVYVRILPGNKKARHLVRLFGFEPDGRIMSNHSNGSIIDCELFCLKSENLTLIRQNQVISYNNL